MRKSVISYKLEGRTTERSIARSTRPSTHIQSVSLSVEAANQSNNNNNNNNNKAFANQIVIFQQTRNPIQIQWGVSWKVTNCYSVDFGVVVEEPTVHRHCL
jgi:hypothetical protein